MCTVNLNSTFTCWIWNEPRRRTTGLTPILPTTNGLDRKQDIVLEYSFLYYVNLMLIAKIIIIIIIII